jgi:cytidylate kinase
MIIAVDGPAGAGKSTVAKILAQKLGFLYIDTGAMYRALTLKAIEENIDTKDTASLVQCAANSNIDLKVNKNGALKIVLDQKDVTAQIREPRITKLVSDISKVKGVREIMVALQRRLGQEKDSVLDGRDIGTVVFPEADRKFYIDAKFEERVRRRYKELKATGLNITMDSVASDLRNRDKIDSTREHSPLKKADDAIYIDTTDMKIEEVVEWMLKEIKR